jgi:hypothetical protein
MSSALRPRGRRARAIARNAIGKPTRRLLTEAEYQRLCRGACLIAISPIEGETLEEAYWWVVCRAVHQHFGAELKYEPVAGLSRGEAYRRSLRQLVEGRRAESFDPLAIARAHVTAAVARQSERERRDLSPGRGAKV